MPLCVHYQAARRNPYRLLELCGFDGQPKTASGGRAFLQKLKTLPSGALRPLLLLAGGFLDGMTGCAHAILEHLPSPLFDECDAYYREHDENEDMLDIVNIYGAAGKTVVLAGHSWGASSMTLNVAAKTSMPVELLVTLDPVDWRKPPLIPPASIRHWLNVYVDYGLAGWSPSNLIARFGGPWQYLKAAEVNQVFSGAHNEAPRMFRDYALDAVRATLRSSGRERA